MATQPASTTPILEGAVNYSLWKLRMDGEFAREKVTLIISGEDTAATQLAAETAATSSSTVSAIYGVVTTSTSAIRDSFPVRDARARGIIHKFISDSILVSVGHLKGAKETWDFIVAAHEKVNVAATAFFTLVSMLDTKWDGTSDFDKHVTNIRTGNLRLTGMSRG
ncbi:hypothetical protein DFH06DRAFT_968084, partial [Mycena polygramma]